MWWSLVLYVIFALACLSSLGCTLACTPLVYIIIQLLFLSWWLCRVWNLCLNCLPKSYHFSVFVTISCISTIFLYSYRSPVSVLFYCVVIYDSDIRCAITCQLTPACYHLTPVWYHLSPTTWYITTWLVIIISVILVWLVSIFAYFMPHFHTYSL